MPIKNKILIAGAGISGLIAALELSREGYEVTLLEARDRIGGRINTIHDKNFPQHIELGAEFIHGDLPLTISLLERYKIRKIKTDGNFFYAKNKNFEKTKDVVFDFHGELESCLKKQVTDMSVNDFLIQNFSEHKYELLKQSVIRFTEGFDTANPADASILAFKEEWLKSDSDQYRIDGGYIKLIDSLLRDCKDNGCKVITDETIKQIFWSKGNVRVVTKSKTEYFSDKIIITFPVGIWNANENDTAGFSLIPELPEIRKAASEVGFGSVIKFILRFEKIFWTSDTVKLFSGFNTSAMGFVISSEVVPTWWTQLPDDQPVITGWLGGPDVNKYSHMEEEELLALATDSLKSIFGEVPQVKAYYIKNWNKDIYSNGSYSYHKLNTKKAIQQMNTPVEKTIYIAGEALYDGEGMATVEGALFSGRNAAGKIINDDKEL